MSSVSWNFHWSLYEKKKGSSPTSSNWQATSQHSRSRTCTSLYSRRGGRPTRSTSTSMLAERETKRGQLSGLRLADPAPGWHRPRDARARMQCKCVCICKHRSLADARDSALLRCCRLPPSPSARSPPAPAPCVIAGSVIVTPSHFWSNPASELAGGGVGGGGGGVIVCCLS